MSRPNGFFLVIMLPIKCLQLSFVLTYFLGVPALMNKGHAKPQGIAVVLKGHVVAWGSRYWVRP